MGGQGMCLDMLHHHSMQIVCSGISALQARDKEAPYPFLSSATKEQYRVDTRRSCLREPCLPLVSAEAGRRQA